MLGNRCCSRQSVKALGDVESYAFSEKKKKKMHLHLKLSMEE